MLTSFMSIQSFKFRNAEEVCQRGEGGGRDGGASSISGDHQVEAESGGGRCGGGGEAAAQGYSDSWDGRNQGQGRESGGLERTSVGTFPLYCRIPGNPRGRGAS